MLSIILYNLGSFSLGKLHSNSSAKAVGAFGAM